MNTSVLSNGEYLNVKLGLVKEIRESSIIFSVNGEELTIDSPSNTLNQVKKIVEDNEVALIPIHMETRNIILDFEVPESKLKELFDDE